MYLGDMVLRVEPQRQVRLRVSRSGGPISADALRRVGLLVAFLLMSTVDFGGWGVETANNKSGGSEVENTLIN